VILQAVSPFVDDLLAGEVFDAVVGVFTTVVPLPILSLAVFGSIGVGYYLVQQRIIIPIVMFSIIGGTTLARAPAAFNNAVLATFVLAIAGIGFVLLQRARV